MALIDCPTCKREMAWSARRCPHCGAISPRVQSGRRGLWICALIVGALVLFFVWLFLWSSILDAPSQLSRHRP